MTALRIFAIAAILAVSAFAWVVLGASVQDRTSSQDSELRGKVGGLWGSAQQQQAPTFKADSTRLPIASTKVKADFSLQQRRKGLLWYPTYRVAYDGAYAIRNDGLRTREVTMTFPFPSPQGTYDGFAINVNGRPVTPKLDDGVATAIFAVKPGTSALAEVSYRSQGLGSWTYADATGGGVAVMRDFTLVMTTDFKNVDFPDGAVSPTSKKPTAAGWEMTWRYDSLVSGRAIALTMPQPLNPGPLASRVSFFAPVALLFYFASLLLLTTTRKLRVHPMNYAFLAAGFFAFHLLFAYLADQVDINLAFAIASVASLVLCVGYLAVVMGPGPALIEVAVAQGLFLVLFSYSFFFDGITGLTITIGAVLTLGYFMARTAKVDWAEVFERKPKAPAPLPQFAPAAYGPPAYPPTPPAYPPVPAE